jgi:hypothetical protein
MPGLVCKYMSENHGVTSMFIERLRIKIATRVLLRDPIRITISGKHPIRVSTMTHLNERVPTYIENAPNPMPSNSGVMIINTLLWMLVSFMGRVLLCGPMSQMFRMVNVWQKGARGILVSVFVFCYLVGIAKDRAG